MKLPDLLHVSIDMASEGTLQQHEQQPHDEFVSSGAHAFILSERFDVSLP